MRIITLLSILLLSTPSFAQSRNKLLGKSSIDNINEWESREKFTLRKQVYKAFDSMAEAAAKDGITLTIVSAYRSFDRQKQIWEGKWKAPERAEMTDRERALNILLYSSMPGTSRHHWGTDIDLNSVEPEYFDQPQGEQIYEWLCKNADKFGFFQPYTEGRTMGYATEKWHWSYAPLSKKYLKKYLKRISNSDINGFDGCHIANEIDMIKGWVMLE